MIEVADYNDLSEILELQKLAFQIEAERYNDPNLPPLNQSLEEIQKQYSDNTFFLKHVSEGKITGSVRAYLDDKNICHIGRLIVHPDHQKKGIGKSLMDEIEKRFSECYAYRIFTGHLSHHIIRLYTKLGYQLYYTQFADTHHIIHMEKRN